MHESLIAITLIDIDIDDYHQAVSHLCKFNVESVHFVCESQLISNN